jgi:recombination associated protein RdgC
MFYKNLFVFAFTKPFRTNEEEVREALNDHLFSPCGATELSRSGWTSALGKGSESTVHTNNGCMFLSSRKEEKILPSSVIKERLDIKILELEKEHSRKATKKEREQLKEDIIELELLPNAFTKTSFTEGYICPDKNIIVINTSSRGKAEDFLALLRKCLGTLPVITPSPDRATDEIMTEWLTDKTLAPSFTLGEEGEFRALGDDGAIIRCKNQDLFSDEIKTHLDSDKYLVKVAIEWDETLSCIITEDLEIKRLKFFDVIHEENDDIDSDDVLARIDADLALMSGEINRFIEEYFGLFNLTFDDFIEK